MTRPILYLSGPYSPANGRSTEDNIAVLRERCPRVERYYYRRGTSAA